MELPDVVKDARFAGIEQYQKRKTGALQKAGFKDRTSILVHQTHKGFWECTHSAGCGWAKVNALVGISRLRANGPEELFFFSDPISGHHNIASDDHFWWNKSSTTDEDDLRGPPSYALEKCNEGISFKATPSACKMLETAGITNRIIVADK